MDNPPGEGLRERKKLQTRESIQREALRLFLAKGYDATTVEEIAAAANVSPMTFFRYFPTKEDVVLTDDYDPLIAARLAARPTDEPAIEKIRHALLDGLDSVYATDRDAIYARTRLIVRTPQLRARLWEQQDATERWIAGLLTGDPGDVEQVMRARVVAAAGLAAATTAILLWIEQDGSRELPNLIDQAFAALRAELSTPHG